VPNLDPVVVKVVVDDSALDKAAGKATKTGAAIKKMGTDGTTHTLRLKESFTSLVEHVDGMPPVVGQASRSLESMFSTGVGGAGLLTAGVGAAAAAVLAFAEEAARKYQGLVEETEAYSRVTGESAEMSSRQLEAFQELGVSAGDATGAMVKLDKAIITAPKHLEALGVEIAHNKDGTTDLNGTLINIIDAYNSTSDAAKRTEIALAAFGKTGANMLPILAVGSDKLRQMEDSAKLVFSEEDIKRVHDFKIEQQQMNREMDSFAAGPGRLWTDVQKGMIESVLEATYVSEKFDEADKKSVETTGRHITNSRALSGELQRQYREGNQAKEGLDKLAAAQKDAAEAAQRHRDALDALYNAEDASIHASLTLERDDMKVTESQNALTASVNAHKKAVDEVDLKLDAYNKTVRTYGANSDEARTAQDALTAAQDAATKATTSESDAVLTAKEDLLAAAGAAQKAQEETDKLTDGTVNAEAAHYAYVQKLEDEASHLAPGSALRVWLEQYIDKLNAIPAAKTTTITENLYRHDYTGQTDSGQRGYASGGRPPVGLPSVVGEEGPEIWVPDRPGTIYPHGVQPPSSEGVQSGGDTTINVSVTHRDPTPDEIAREIAWRLSTRRA
jgi:hypothetical protein